MPFALEFQTIAVEVMSELLSKWIALQPTDYRRVTRPKGQGHYSIEIEAYRGSTTWIPFYQYLQSSEAMTRLRQAIAEFQPELGGYLITPGSSMQLEEGSNLVVAWCQELEARVGKFPDVESAIRNLLDDLSDLLDKKALSHQVITSISGLRLPGTTLEIVLAPNVILRTMSDDEIAILSRQDITFGRENDVMANAVSSCIVFETNSPFSIEAAPPQALLMSTAQTDAGAFTLMVLRAIHVVKSGRAGVFQCTENLTPKLLPLLSGGISWPLQRPPFSSLELSLEDVGSFTVFFQALQSGVRDEVTIAIDRLVDAENRLSPVDALMDAAIGLEVLLNPMDSAELAFRAALNYAFLASPEFRRERYERVRAIQKIRNRVVHGGLNLQSQEAQKIHEYSTLARACLRDVIKSFLLDPTLTGNKKLDADFWLDRVLPPSISAKVEIAPMQYLGN